MATLLPWKNKKKKSKFLLLQFRVLLSIERFQGFDHTQGQVQETEVSVRGHDETSDCVIIDHRGILGTETEIN